MCKSGLAEDKALFKGFSEDEQLELVDVCLGLTLLWSRSMVLCPIVTHYAIGLLAIGLLDGT